VSVLHGKCNMCGQSTAAVEVEIPHATRAHMKAAGVASTSTLCAAVCEDCARAVTAAHAKHGAAGFAQWKAERAVLRTWPEQVDR
jgi:hypothetical protein